MDSPVRALTVADYLRLLSGMFWRPETSSCTVLASTVLGQEQGVTERKILTGDETGGPIGWWRWTEMFVFGWGKEVLRSSNRDRYFKNLNVEKRLGPVLDFSNSDINWHLSKWSKVWAWAILAL